MKESWDSLKLKYIAERGAYLSFVKNPANLSDLYMVGAEAGSLQYNLLINMAKDRVFVYHNTESDLIRSMNAGGAMNIIHPAVMINLTTRDIEAREGRSQKEKQRIFEFVEETIDRGVLGIDDIADIIKTSIRNRRS